MKKNKKIIKTHTKVLSPEEIDRILTPIGFTLDENCTSFTPGEFKDFTEIVEINVDKKNPVFCSVDGVLFDKAMTRLIAYPINKDKTDYIIPEGIQYIGDYAFFNCKHLENIVLPDSVSFIGESAFARCERLKTITLSFKLRYDIEYVIRGETGLQTISNSGNPKIGSMAFEEFEGQFVYKGEFFISRASYDRNGCNKLSIRNEDKLWKENYMNIEDLFEFKFDKRKKSWSVTGYCGKNKDVVFPAAHKGKPVKAIGVCFSENNKKIKRITIPEGYTSIGDAAFENCTELMKIKLPESLISIGDTAFYRCTGLKNIELPKSLTSIGELAFYGCTGLTVIKLPESLTSIGRNVFYDCTGITNIIVDENNSAFRSVDGVLFDKAMTTLLLFPEGKKGKYSVPDGIIKIGADAFIGCRELTGIFFPQSLLYIESYDFNNEQLTDITVSELNTEYSSIDGVLFNKKMTELMEYPRNRDKTYYTIPDGIKHIKKNAFYGCKRLVNLVLPESLEIIGDFEFAESVEDDDYPEILAFLKAVKEGVFEKCTNLKTVTLSRKTKIGYKAFERFKGKLVYRN